MQEELNWLTVAFRRVLGCEPRQFKDQASGLTDDRDGVQWHAVILREDDSLHFGVNLEGMKYDGWPIARLLHRELEAPQLPDLVALLPRSDDISLRVTLDAWQASIRPPIEEWHLCWRPLAGLGEAEWRDVVERAVGLFAGSRDAPARGEREVTLTSTGEKRTMPTSPHLHFWVRIRDEDRRQDLMTDAIRDGVRTLLPLHAWTTARCAR